uniref:Uncharacterized protein n=1 Tax=Romanomermis culicivorax TaxID=13658 RepID=A0A915K7J4_ROMCU
MPEKLLALGAEQNLKKAYITHTLVFLSKNDLAETAKNMLDVYRKMMRRPKQKHGDWRIFLTRAYLMPRCHLIMRPAISNLNGNFHNSEIIEGDFHKEHTFMSTISMIEKTTTTGKSAEKLFDNGGKQEGQMTLCREQVSKFHSAISPAPDIVAKIFDVSDGWENKR